MTDIGKNVDFKSGKNSMEKGQLSELKVERTYLARTLEIIFNFIYLIIILNFLILAWTWQPEEINSENTSMSLCSTARCLSSLAGETYTPQAQIKGHFLWRAFPGLSPLFLHLSVHLSINRHVASARCAVKQEIFFVLQFKKQLNFQHN